MIAVSEDGAAWSAISLEDAFGTKGSQEVAIAGVDSSSPSVPAYATTATAGFESVPEPQWWFADIGS